MKALIITLAAAAILAVVPDRDAQAHRPGYVSSHISVGIGYGYKFLV